MACKTFELDSNGKKIREISDAELKLRLLEDEELYNKVTGITPKTWDIKKLEEEKQRIEDIFREMEDINLLDKDGWIEDNADPKEMGIANFIHKIAKKGFERFGDRNLIGANLARTYFARNSEKGVPIDVLAQEISEHIGIKVSEQDIIDFMTKYPSGIGGGRSTSEKTFHGVNNPKNVVARMIANLEHSLGTKLTPERERILYEKWKQIDERLKEIDARNLTQDELNAMQDEYSEYYKNLNNEQREQLHAEERIEAGENQPMESETDAESESTPRNDRPDTTSGEKGKPTERTERAKEKAEQPDKETSASEAIGTKKAKSIQDREEVGLPPIDIPKNKGQQGQLNEAKEKVDSGEIDANELESYFISHKDNPSNAESSEFKENVLKYNRLKIEARRKANATERLELEDKVKKDPTDTQSALDIASNEVERQQLIYALDRNTIATRISGAALSKAFSSRQYLVDEKGIIQQQIDRIRELHGDAIPKEVQEKLDAQQIQIEDLNNKIQAIENKLTEQEAQSEINRGIKRKPLIRRSNKRTNEEINEEIKDKVSRIASKIAERIESKVVKHAVAPESLSKSLIADIAPDVMDVVRLVTEKSGNKLADVVNKTYDTLADVIEGITKDDITDIIAGKYNEKRPLSELQKQLNDIRSQVKLLDKIAELEDGIVRQTKARGESSPEVKVLRERAAELTKKAKNEIPEVSANELRKQAEQIQKKIDKGDYLKRPQLKKVFEQDAEWVKYDQQKKNLKMELNHLEAKALFDQKNIYMKTLDQLNKFGRIGLFVFSTAYQLKLGAAALSAFAHSPIENMIGTAMKPFFKEIAKRAPIEGRSINTEATIALYKELNPISILRGAYQILSKGESDLSRELSSHPKKEGALYNPLSDHSFLNWIADDPHKILKNPVKEGIFNASLANYLDYYAKNGMDINDPVLIEKARQASYMRAEYEIFMGGEKSKNAVAEWFGKMSTEGILEAQSEDKGTKVKGNLKYTIGALKTFIVPIATVPANILNRTIKANPFSTVSKFAEALSTNKQLRNSVEATLDKMTEQQADMMYRDLKKGAIGSVYWTLGFYMAGSALGGFFNKSYPDKKRDEDVKAHDEMEIFGTDIPHGVQHAVPLQQMQMAATFALTLKYFNEKDERSLEEEFGAIEKAKNVAGAGAEVARGYLHEHPYAKAAIDIQTAIEGGKSRERYINNMKRRTQAENAKFYMQKYGLIEKDKEYEELENKKGKHKGIKDLYDLFGNLIGYNQDHEE